MSAEIRNIKWSKMTMIEPPSDAIIGMWRDLFNRANDLDIDDPRQDLLTENERKLYNVLTERLTEHLALIGYTEIILDENGQKYKVS